MDTVALLQALCTPQGVSGTEGPAAQAAMGLLEKLGLCEQTPVGSILCRVRPAREGEPHLLLTAHLDTIGMIVTFLDEKGFLRVGACGGVDRSAVLAAQVQVHTAQGILEGVVCTVPPHLNPDESKLSKMEELAVDVGLSGPEVKERVQLGDRITFCTRPMRLGEDTFSCGGLDDRAGCAAVLLAARELADKPLGCGLSVALAAQEETGGPGASGAAFQLRPTHAIAVDVSFGHTPDAPRAKCGIMGEGPMIGIAPILDQEIFTQLKEAARHRELPFQVEVMGGRTGTDADAVATSGAGVRCGLVSIPQRYMHTPVETVRIQDVEHTAQLIAGWAMDQFGGDR